MKNLLSSLTLIAALSTLIPVQLASADIECGNWDDVPESRMEVITTICEYGLMQGYNEENWGYGNSIVRPELTHIANRIAMGYSDYTEALDSMDWEDAYDSLEGYFTDVPNPYENASYEWLVEAMYFGQQNGIMKGDGNTYPTTYRPFDNSNVVETWKVLYQAAYQGDVLSDDVDDKYVSYSGNPWWGDLMEKLEDENVIYHLDTDYQSFWLSGAITISYTDFSKAVDREDVALFLYNMIQDGLIDEEELMDRLNDGDYFDLAVTELYIGSSSETSGSVYVQVSNLGTQEIELDEDLNLQLFVNEAVPFRSISVADLELEDDDFLEPGGISTFGPYEFDFMEDEVGGIESIRAHMDEDEVLEESDEDNNILDLEL